MRPAICTFPFNVTLELYTNVIVPRHDSWAKESLKKGEDTKWLDECRQRMQRILARISEYDQQDPWSVEAPWDAFTRFWSEVTLDPKVRFSREVVWRMYCVTFAANLFNAALVASNSRYRPLRSLSEAFLEGRFETDVEVTRHYHSTQGRIELNAFINEAVKWEDGNDFEVGEFLDVERQVNSHKSIPLKLLAKFTQQWKIKLLTDIVRLSDS